MGRERAPRKGRRKVCLLEKSMAPKMDSWSEIRKELYLVEKKLLELELDYWKERRMDDPWVSNLVPRRVWKKQWDEELVHCSLWGSWWVKSRAA